MTALQRLAAALERTGSVLPFEVYAVSFAITVGVVVAVVVR